MRTEDKRPSSPLDELGPDFWIIGVLLIVAIVATSFSSFLLFHCVVEMFSIVIACSIFIVAWNTRHISDNSFLLFMGIAYLFVGGLDFIHMLAYEGMGVFKGYGANLPTQLWIGARYLESFSLLIAPVFLFRPLKTGLTMATYLVLVTAFLLSLFYWNLFPDCFIAGRGLTEFKIYSEYSIVLILMAALFLFCRKRTTIERSLFPLIIGSIVLTITGELAFTFYISTSGLSNFVGHIFKILSFYLIYRTVVFATLKNPYKALFRKIVESEEAKTKIIDELKATIDHVKLLEGCLPICASCKNIRDDNGQWNQIEQYFSDHSTVEFTHGVCPDCAERLYPDAFSEEKSEQ